MLHKTDIKFFSRHPENSSIKIKNGKQPCLNIAQTESPSAKPWAENKWLSACLYQERKLRGETMNYWRLQGSIDCVWIDLKSRCHYNLFWGLLFSLIGVVQDVRLRVLFTGKGHRHNYGFYGVSLSPSCLQLLIMNSHSPKYLCFLLLAILRAL